MSTTPGTVIQSTANSSGKASRLALGVVLSALSGLMLLVSFPPYGIWPLIWVGFVPYLLAQYRLMPFKWSSLAAALANLLWLGPFLGRLFGTEFGFFFTFLGVPRSSRWLRQAPSWGIPWPRRPG
jgi:apolipoprotein N-acyltransferase